MKFDVGENIVCIKDFKANIYCLNLGNTNIPSTNRTPEYDLKKGETYVVIGYSRIDGKMFIKDKSVRIFTYSSEYFDSLKNIRKSKLRKLNERHKNF